METSTEKSNYIDVRKVIKNKSPKLYKLLPRFVINYIRRVIHEDQLNEFMQKNANCIGGEFIDRSLEYLNVKVLSHGISKIPTDSRYIFVANHPLGGLDGIIFIREIEKHFGKVKAVVNDVLTNVANLKPLFVGVNLYGANSRENIVELDKTFESDAQIMFFPAGLVSRKVHGIIQDLEWKRTFINRAKRHNLQIVPVFISGRNSSFFYNLSNFRTKLGIKLNLELIYLPDQMFKQNNKTIALTYGKPIHWKTFDKKYSTEEWAAKVREYVYELSKNPDAVFMGEK